MINNNNNRYCGDVATTVCVHGMIELALTSSLRTRVTDVGFALESMQWQMNAN